MVHHISQYKEKDRLTLSFLAGISDSATYGNYYGALKFLNSVGDAWGGNYEYYRNAVPKIVVVKVGTTVTLYDVTWNGGLGATTSASYSKYQNPTGWHGSSDGTKSIFTDSYIFKDSAAYGNWYNLASSYGFTQTDILTDDSGNFTNPTFYMSSGSYGQAKISNFLARKAGLAIICSSFRLTTEDPSVQHAAYTLVIAYS